MQYPNIRIRQSKHMTHSMIPCFDILFILGLAAVVSADNFAITLNASILPSVLIPPSFLGLSHEPLNMSAVVLPTPEYQGLIKLLSSFDTGPFLIRWGGNAQDQQGVGQASPADGKVLSDDQWQAMAGLHNNTGTRFMIGLNLLVRGWTATCYLLPRPCAKYPGTRYCYSQSLQKPCSCRHGS